MTKIVNSILCAGTSACFVIAGFSEAEILYHMIAGVPLAAIPFLWISKSKKEKNGFDTNPLDSSCEQALIEYENQSDLDKRMIESIRPLWEEYRNLMFTVLLRWKEDDGPDIKWQTIGFILQREMNSMARLVVKNASSKKYIESGLESFESALQSAIEKTTDLIEETDKEKVTKTEIESRVIKSI